MISACSNRNMGFSCVVRTRNCSENDFLDSSRLVRWNNRWYGKGCHDFSSSKDHSTVPSTLLKTLVFLFRYFTEPCSVSPQSGECTRSSYRTVVASWSILPSPHATATRESPLLSAHFIIATERLLTTRQSDHNVEVCTLAPRGKGRLSARRVQPKYGKFDPMHVGDWQKFWKDGSRRTTFVGILVKPLHSSSEQGPEVAKPTSFARRDPTQRRKALHPRPSATALNEIDPIASSKSSKPEI